MGILIIGAILALIGLFLLRGSKKAADKLLSIQMLETTNTKNLIENYNSLSTDYGKGSFSLHVKLKGTAFSDEPLLGAYSKLECVYYKTSVTRSYEVQEERKDAEGKIKKQWVTKEEVLVEDEQVANDFYIKDDHGKVLVNPSSAELHLKESFSKFDEGEDFANTLHFNIRDYITGSNGNTRTLGYTYKESMIPVNQRLLAIGEANDRAGDLMVSKPNEKTAPFIVSVKTEDEIANKIGKSQNSKKIGGMVLSGLGGLTIIIGILKILGVF